MDYIVTEKTDLEVVYAHEGESLADLKNKSQRLQLWLTKQDSECIAKLIELYHDFLKHHSPYYMD